MIDGIYLVVLMGLLGLNAWQFWFWSRQNHRLIDKIMSRNYAEYVQSENLAKPSPPRKTSADQHLNVSDPLLDELNSII